ncbi:hypothetical protein ACFQO1_05335 [Jejudonia soesokkakensis]|uniref:ApeA N-terminal domain-containing protein n=1 Tax=Jejudonia soesokkakensis TaxID=1323432 RepID=A0ABW2MTF7_9FLAO
MKDNLRYALWAINGITVQHNYLSKKIQINDELIDIVATDYDGVNQLSDLHNDWVENKIMKNISTSITYTPIPHLNVYVTTLNPVKNLGFHKFAFPFNLALELVYHDSYVSHTSEYVPKGGVSCPGWVGWDGKYSKDSHTINPKTFDKVVQIYNSISKFTESELSVLYSLTKISKIRNIKIELLCLWTFIEGYWYNGQGSSKVKKSFERMLLHDYAKGNQNLREAVTEKVKSQNSNFRRDTIDDIRHILAHGMDKRNSTIWSTNQWEAIREQRKLLFEIITVSLINRIKNNIV